MPIAQLFASANGGQFSYNYDHKRFRHFFTLGFAFTNYVAGTELHLFSSNGRPIDKWSTEVDIETQRPYPLGGVVNQIDFAFETTLATRSHVKTIEKAKNYGYFISTVFLGLNSPELAIERVNIRVEEGGHDIPKHVIRRRYYHGYSDVG